MEAVQGVAAPIPVLSQAWEYSTDNGQIAVDPAKRRITVETPPMYCSHWNSTSAGLEMKLKRYVQLRFTGTFNRFNKEVMLPKRHFVKYDNVNCFAGLILDFGTAKGYAVRTRRGSGQGLSQTHRRQRRMSMAPSVGLIGLWP